MTKFKIGISIGDINGIGMEVVLKSFIDARMFKLCTPIVYGSSKITAYHKNIIDQDEFQFNSIRSIQEPLSTDKLNVLNVWNDSINIQIGSENEVGGEYAMRSLAAATEDLMRGEIDGLVTAPLSKKAVNMAGNEDFIGQTEFLTRRLGATDSLMFMVSDALKVGIVSNHYPIREVAKKIHQKAIIEKARIMNQSLKRDFGIQKPLIAVLGLNPHAGDNGLIGNEDQEIIIPAIQKLKEEGIEAFGPFPADGFFGSNNFLKFDATLAMYHDQGLIPFKIIAQNNGVNFTAGLSIVRTSPDHGTAFGLAGKNEAKFESFRTAVYTAIDILQSREDFDEMHANPLEKRSQRVVYNKKLDEDEELRRLSEAERNLEQD